MKNKIIGNPLKTNRLDSKNISGKDTHQNNLLRLKK